MNKNIYSFLGLPASGKGTQAEVFAQKRKLPLISIGDLVRDEIEESKKITNPKIEEIKNRYNKGTPQSDQVVFDLIKKKLKNILGGIVFDNFPFSLNQASFLFEQAKAEEWDLPILVYIKISEKSSYKRILSRKICPKCNTIIKGNNKTCPECGSTLIRRSDDNNETLSKRIKYYSPRIEEMRDFYKKNGRVIIVDGEPSIEEVTKQIESI